MIRKIVFALTIFLPFILFSGCIHGDYLNIEIPDDITIRYSDDHDYDCTYFNPEYYPSAKDTIKGTFGSGVTVRYGYVFYTVPDSYSTHTNRRDYTIILCGGERGDYNGEEHRYKYEYELTFEQDTYAGQDGYDDYCSNNFTIKKELPDVNGNTYSVNCQFVRTTF